ncbi:MAG: UPF0149 family protein [Burkholderiales bacterium]
MTGLKQPLSEAELEELDDFLGDGSIEDTSMCLSTLEGFLASLAIGPRIVLPSQWLPWVWDMKERRRQAQFESDAHANRIMLLAMRLYNAVVLAFSSTPVSFEPIFWRGAQWGAAGWCEGFLLGYQFNGKAWSLLTVAQPKWFTPFFRLGTEDGIHLTKDSGDGERWMNEIAPSLVNIDAYWKKFREGRSGGMVTDDFHLGGHREAKPVVRASPKVGRNDACPCGSGRKYKKCCAVGQFPPSAH